MKIVSAFVLAALVGQVEAEPTAAALSSIRVMGTATVTAKPERALIDVGVLTQEKQSQAATAQNSKQLDAVLGALHRLLGADADIHTVNLALNPDYQFRAIGNKPAINGFTALSVVRITLDDLSRVGPAIDAATQAGANHVESVQYIVRDPQALHAQGLREAAAKARADADVLAAALNLKVVKIVSVEEARETPNPVLDMSDPDPRPGPGDPGAVQSGSLETNVSVTLTVEVGTR